MGRRQPMINALARLGGMTPGELPKSMAAMGIAGGIGKLFSDPPADRGAHRRAASRRADHVTPPEKPPSGGVSFFRRQPCCGPPPRPP
jgi:hypothetical protein